MADDSSVFTGKPDVATYPDAIGRVDYSMIGLHGRDADKHAFFPFVRLMGFLHTRWVLPSAVFANTNEGGGFRWYDEGEGAASRMESSRRLIHSLIESEIAQGVAPENVFLVGFSQGAAMALDSGLRYPTRLGGIVALSGALVFPDLLEKSRHAANSRLPIFWGHGERDLTVPMESAKNDVNRLRSMGYSVEWREYATGHRISSLEVRDIRAFLHRHMYGFPMNDPREAVSRIAPF